MRPIDLEFGPGMQPVDGRRPTWNAVVSGTSIQSVARLLVMWTDPTHLSAEEAELWVREQSRHLLELDDVDHLRLTRLVPPSRSHAQPWDWLLEVELRPGLERIACADEPPFADWLRDLRLLGMRPVHVAAGEALAIEREAH